MKIKKSVSLLLACMMFSSFAVACNGTGGSGSDGDVIGEYTGGGFGAAGSAAPGSGYGGSGYVGGTTSGSSSSLGDYESTGSGTSGSTGGSGVGNYETSGDGGASGVGSSNSGSYEGTYTPSAGGSTSGDLGSYETSGTGGSDGVLSGGTGGSYEGSYTGSTSGSASDYEASGDGGASSVVGTGSSASGNLDDYEAGVDTTYQGATELADSEWRAVQGYNYFYYEQLGEDVMPIGAWCAPPTTYGDFTTDQITVENYQKVKDVGLNSVYGLYERAQSPGYTDVLNALYCADQVGIVYLVRDNNAYASLKLDGVTAIDDVFYEYMRQPAYGGTLFVDEPGFMEFENIGAGTKEWKKHELFGETKLAYVNNLPLYANAAQLYYGAGTTNTSAPVDYASDYELWLEAYMSMVDPQIFSYDFYPFNGENDSFTSGYFDQLSMVRRVCMKYNVPFWNFAQVGSWGGTRQFSEAELAFQMNSALAYGAKGVQWFNCWQPYEMSASYVNAFLDHYGNPTVYYEYGQRINAQIAAVDHVLLKSKSMGIIPYGNSLGGSIPSSDVVGSYGALSSVSGSGDFIVGCFEYRDIGYAYYIASNSTTSSATAILNFNTSYTLEKIQDATTSTTTASQITVSLAAGGGALVVVPNN